MKISKSYFNPDEEYPASSLELIDQAIAKNYLQSSLNRKCSRSLLPLESSNHRNYGKVNHSSFTVPKFCKIAEEKYSETAFSVLQYQLKDRQVIQTHVDNLKRNLERRLQTAKAQGNNQLVSLLNHELTEIVSL